MTVRSAGGQRYRRKTWFTLYLPSYEAVDVARFEDMCTVAEDQALTVRTQERVRHVLDDGRAVLRTAVSVAERLD